MTHDTVTNFAASLVEMAKAHERVPLLEKHVENLELALADRGDQVQRLELRIIDLKADQDALYAKLRSVEAERDDAGFRELEAQDRVAVLKRALQAVFHDTGEALKACEPVPVTAVVTVVEQPHPFGEHGGGMAQPLTQDGEFPSGQSAEHPTVDVVDISHTTVSSEPVGSAASANTEGQREPDPTVLSQAGSGNELQSVPSTDVGATSIASIADDEPIHGPYHGRRYISYPGWVSREDWLAGGGTIEDYDWRPEPKTVEDGEFSRASHYGT